MTLKQHKRGGEEGEEVGNTTTYNRLKDPKGNIIDNMLLFYSWKGAEGLNAKAFLLYREKQVFIQTGLAAWRGLGSLNCESSANDFASLTPCRGWEYG